MERPEITPPRDHAEIFVIDISRIGMISELPEPTMARFRRIFEIIQYDIDDASEYRRRINRVFNVLYQLYVEFYNSLPLDNFNMATNESTSLRDLFIPPNRLDETLTEILGSVKEGDIIRLVTPMYTLDTFIYISNERGALILNDISRIKAEGGNEGHSLPGVAITYLSRSNLGTFTKINSEYPGAEIIAIKVPANPNDFINWKRAQTSRYLEDKDDINYVRYKNFKLYVGEEIVPDEPEFIESDEDEQN